MPATARNFLARFIPCACAAALGACTPSPRPIGVVDTGGNSLYAPARLIVPFREHVPEHPSALGTGSTANIDSLFTRYVGALEQRDTAALRPLALTVSEFAWLYYLDSPMARKPYELDPDAMWTQIDARSARGLSRALDALGGNGVQAWRSSCDAPRVSGAVQLHDCTLTVRPVRGKIKQLALRLSAVELAGRFKLVGFATTL